MRIILSFMETLASKDLSSILTPTDSIRDDGSEVLIALSAELTFPIFIMIHLLNENPSYLFVLLHKNLGKSRKRSGATWLLGLTHICPFAIIAS